MNQRLQSAPLPTKPRRRYFQAAAGRSYTTAQAIERLNMARRTFFALKAQGQLPLVELCPRLGRVVRYQAAPIDRWVAGQGR